MRQRSHFYFRVNEALFACIDQMASLLLSSKKSSSWDDDWQEEDESSDSDSRDSSSSSSKSWSSSCSSEDYSSDEDDKSVENIMAATASVFRWPSLRRRFRDSELSTSERDSSEREGLIVVNNDDSGSSEGRRRRNNTESKRSFIFQRQQHLRRNWKQWIPLCGCLSTYILLGSFMIWLAFGLYSYPVDLNSSPTRGRPTRGRVRAGHRGVENERGGWIQSIGETLDSALTITLPRKHVLASVEELQPGCKPSDWQNFNFPNCNEIHEIDLTTIRRREKKKSPSSGIKVGYLASGLWRSVWAVDPRQPMTSPVVLKIMKQEHKVDSRNMDRHRRDALVMERLTSSPNVVDIYGHCGNSVLTEYIDTPLDKLIDGSKQSAGVSIENPRDRIRLALDMAKGLRALHEIKGGPIIHADIQVPQFLVSPSGSLKVNDFNRCRFMAQDGETGKSCKLGIPTAPGKNRAPEEYEMGNLDEKIDIFSLANIYFTLLTRTPPWDSLPGTRAKKNIRKGFKPVIEEKFRSEPTDAALANLTMRAYELDSDKRISAAELVEALEKLLV